MVRDAEGTEIDGVRLLPLHPHHDERGTFTEVFAAHWGAGIDPAQWSVVHSAPGVLRGMHLHLRHDELVTSGGYYASLVERQVRGLLPTHPVDRRTGIERAVPEDLRRHA